MNNVLTASRMNCAMTCARQHFWCYEVGMRKDETPHIALRFGGAWARAMEARWLGGSYGDALEAAMPEGVVLDFYDAARCAALLAVYYKHWGERENCAQIHPEVVIPRSPIEGTCMEASGVLDGLGTLKDGRLAIVESKTTAASLEPDSDYWNRLKFNTQILQYAVEAPKMGWNVDVAFYDVTRKPSIRPKMIADRDANGLKIVTDSSTGKRAMKEVGRKGDKRLVPRESGGEGFEVKQHLETPDEFGERLLNDVLSRPEFYFARVEIPLADDTRRMFERHRLELAKLIEYFRSREFEGEQPDSVAQNLVRDPEAWPRSVRDDNCDFCPYSHFCLQNISVDPSRPPTGYSIQPFNPELERQEQKTYGNTSEDDSSAAD